MLDERSPFVRFGQILPLEAPRWNDSKVPSPAFRQAPVSHTK